MAQAARWMRLRIAQAEHSSAACARLAAAQGKLRGGRVASVAGMGVLSAVIVSPCVAAPLAGALLYISQTRDVAMGGAALFTLALGMGAPLVLVGISEGALLPKAGAWMKSVKSLFGVLLLVGFLFFFFRPFFVVGKATCRELFTFIGMTLLFITLYKMEMTGKHNRAQLKALRRRLTGDGPATGGRSAAPRVAES